MRLSGRLISMTSAHSPSPSAPISTSLKTQATHPPSVRERTRTYPTAVAPPISRRSRWYLAFPVSYRDLAAMLSDRGIAVDHTTLFRWVQAYAAELEQRVLRHLRPCTGSWRVDETYIKVKGV